MGSGAVVVGSLTLAGHELGEFQSVEAGGARVLIEGVVVYVDPLGHLLSVGSDPGLDAGIGAAPGPHRNLVIDRVPLVGGKVKAVRPGEVAAAVVALVSGERCG